MRFMLTHLASIGNNGGVGGNVTVGCVTYGFSVGAKYDVGN